MRQLLARRMLDGGPARKAASFSKKCLALTLPGPDALPKVSGKHRQTLLLEQGTSPTLKATSSSIYGLDGWCVQGPKLSLVSPPGLVEIRIAEGPNRGSETSPQAESHLQILWCQRALRVRCRLEYVGVHSGLRRTLWYINRTVCQAATVCDLSYAERLTRGREETCEVAEEVGNTTVGLGLSGSDSPT